MNAVVTGGGRGIGAAVAMRFAKRGAKVVIAARTDAELARTEREIAAAVGHDAVHRVVCDVGDAAAVVRLRDEANAFFGAATVLVNNAGIAPRALAHEMDEAVWDATIDSNLKGTWLCTRAFLPAMLARGAGRIVNVASISSTLGTPRLSAYCAAKWGVVGFTKAVAEETRAAGVQVMAVLPGSVDTDMLKGSGFTATMAADDVAKTIEYLAFDAPVAMTGSAVEMFG
jgi:3-oxoacyl-[acyl-carrier protein] reductase